MRARRCDLDAHVARVHCAIAIAVSARRSRLSERRTQGARTQDAGHRSRAAGRRKHDAGGSWPRG
eukprot:697066-Alexandrium_andersonii.AAC.1